MLTPPGGRANLAVWSAEQLSSLVQNFLCRLLSGALFSWVQLLNGKRFMVLCLFFPKYFIEGFPCTFCLFVCFSFDLPGDFKVSVAGNFPIFTIGYLGTNPRAFP